MAKENGTLEPCHDDTRLELHILEYSVRMATIEKDAIANYTHYLIKIALLPNSRPGFFSFTETKEDYSVTLEEEAFQELPKSSGLSCSDCLWNVLTVSAGAMDTGFAMGISKIVNSIIRPLADNGVSLFCMSTYQGDFILVKQQDLAVAIRCLSGKFKIFDEGGYHNLCPEVNNFESRLNDCVFADNHSHPLVHSIVSPLNKFHIISLNSQHFQSLIPTLIDLMFYSSTRTPPLDGHETFFHFALVDGDLSVVLDDKDLARIPSNYFYTSSGREQWRIIKIGEYPLGYDEYGVVAQIAEPLVEAKITTFYISSCHLGNTLIPDEDFDKALDILNERRKRAQVTQE